MEISLIVSRILVYCLIPTCLCCLSMYVELGYLFRTRYTRPGMATDVQQHAITDIKLTGGVAHARGSWRLFG